MVVRLLNWFLSRLWWRQPMGLGRLTRLCQISSLLARLDLVHEMDKHETANKTQSLLTQILRPELPSLTPWVWDSSKWHSSHGLRPHLLFLTEIPRHLLLRKLFQQSLWNWTADIPKQSRAHWAQPDISPSSDGTLKHREFKHREVSDQILVLS